MKHYSIKLNKKQFRMLYKAWSEAEAIQSGSTDILDILTNNAIAISALKSNDKLLRKIWELLWSTENYNTIIKELDLLCNQGDAICLKPCSSFDELMDRAVDSLYDLSIYLHDSNLSGGAWVNFQFYGLQHMHTLKVENAHREINV